MTHSVTQQDAILMLFSMFLFHNSRSVPQSLNWLRLECDQLLSNVCDCTMHYYKQAELCIRVHHRGIFMTYRMLSPFSTRIMMINLHAQGHNFGTHCLCAMDNCWLRVYHQKHKIDGGLMSLGHVSRFTRLQDLRLCHIQ